MRLPTAAIVLAAVTLGSQSVLANYDFELEAREFADFEEFDARAPKTVAGFDLDARGGIPIGAFSVVKDFGRNTGKRILKSFLTRDLEDLSELEVREVFDDAIRVAKTKKREHRRLAGKHRVLAFARRGQRRLERSSSRFQQSTKARPTDHEEVARELAEDIELAERFVEQLSQDVEARDFEDLEDIDARDFKDFEAFDSREYEELEELAARYLKDLEDVVERAVAAGATLAPSATTSTSTAVLTTGTTTASTSSASATVKAKPKHPKKPKPHRHHKAKKYGKPRKGLKRKTHHKHPHHRSKPGHLKAKPHRKPHRKHKKKDKKQGVKATPTPTPSASVTAPASSTSKGVSTSTSAASSTSTSTSASATATPKA
ncbi:hypothetical protein FA13DRAFT_1796430 [Coprinellus micaceus]|uniref:Uncharacterized protein n=1 Tax=Coprinellus micaceus TaxID=71717 RepID=A0A4Y7SUJ6_COPMI|nr:hypothetical protein FA13DRAFT_1796430 [Coprinellus micaceus]